MRYLNGFLCLLMILFAAVQYNDPDFALWVVIYAIPAAWAGFAAYRPEALRGRLPSLGLVVCIVLAVGGMVYVWPTDPGWWRQEVWWQSETAREGMGLMVVTLVMLAVAATWILARQPRRPEA